MAYKPGNIMELLEKIWTVNKCSTGSSSGIHSSVNNFGVGEVVEGSLMCPVANYSVQHVKKNILTSTCCDESTKKLVASRLAELSGSQPRERVTRKVDYRTEGGWSTELYVHGTLQDLIQRCLTSDSNLKETIPGLANYKTYFNTSLAAFTVKCIKYNWYRFGTVSLLKVSVGQI